MKKKRNRWKLQIGSHAKVIYFNDYFKYIPLIRGKIKKKQKLYLQIERKATNNVSGIFEGV